MMNKSILKSILLFVGHSAKEILEMKKWIHSDQ